MDEIHTKLVEIMQDRLLVAAKQLVTESAEAWKQDLPTESSSSAEQAAAAIRPMGQSERSSSVGNGTVTAGAVPPIPPEGVGDAIRSLAKQLGTLRTVLSPILQEEEVRYIFGRVASMYSDTLAATMDSLLPRGGAWEERRRINALFALQVVGA